MIIKSDIDYPNLKISKLDLKALPKWISERFDSILKDSNNADCNDLITNINNCTAITLTKKQALSHSDLTALLETDIASMKVTIIQSYKLENIEIFEFIPNMSLEYSNHNIEEYSTKSIFENIPERIWDVAKIVWKENNQDLSRNYTIQTKLV